jgi:hypothetical protein
MARWWPQGPPRKRYEAETPSVRHDVRQRTDPLLAGPMSDTSRETLQPGYEGYLPQCTRTGSHISLALQELLGGLVVQLRLGVRL